MSELQVGFVLFPNLTQLDFTGPLQVLSRLPRSTTHIVAKTRRSRAVGRRTRPRADDDVQGLSAARPSVHSRRVRRRSGDRGRGDDGLRAPRRRRAPGTSRACAPARSSSARRGFFAASARRRTGPIIISSRASAPIPEKARVVRDGHVFTGGGVTAGIDFAFTLMSEIAGPQIAQTAQLVSKTIRIALRCGFARPRAESDQVIGRRALRASDRGVRGSAGSGRAQTSSGGPIQTADSPSPSVRCLNHRSPIGAGDAGRTKRSSTTLAGHPDRPVRQWTTARRTSLHVAVLCLAARQVT